MADFTAVCAHITEHTDGIVRWTLDSWESLAESEPWLKLPDDLDQDHLPKLLRHIAAAALDPHAAPKANRQLVLTAAEHGWHRREDGFDEGLLHTEYLLLRRTIWNYLRQEFAADPAVVDAILRIDAAITLASSGSLLGYHRDALEKSGRWPEGVDRVVRDWSFQPART